MPRKESMAVPEGNGPIPQYTCVMLNGIKLEDFRRIMSEVWDKVREENGPKKPVKPKDEMRGTSQRLASPEQDARQPRLAMEADVPADEKTRDRTEGAAKAVQAMHEDSFSAKRTQDGPKSSATFGEKVQPLALSCTDDVSVENGAAPPKSCLSPLKMRTTTTTGGLLPTGKTTTAAWATFDQLTLWCCLTEEKKNGTSVLYAWYYRSSWRNSLLAAPSCRRVIETKSRKNRMCDPGGFYRSSLRLSVFRNVARVALWEGYALGGWKRLKTFLTDG